MQNNDYQNWTITSGDYNHNNSDYNKLYRKGRRREKLVKTMLWIGAAFLAYEVFYKVLAYAAGK
ncbi:MAG: hypothetical protein J0L60_11800 [Ignavibacteria bacterium]|nr:hypothetical protein [Ignavibacteria bacterium]